MGNLQPSLATSTEPVSLWLFARQIAGRECDAYLAWYDAKRGYMRAVDFERVAISVKRRWPNLDETQLFLRELRALEERAARLRGWARHLLATVIPSKVRRELLKGHHLITGRNSLGERVSLTIDDLAGLDIDLTSNSLIGPTTAYTDVSIRPAKPHTLSASAYGIEEGEGELQPAVAPNRRPGPKPLGEEPLTTLIGEVAERVLSAQQPVVKRGWRAAVHREIVGQLSTIQPPPSQSSIEKGARPFLDQWEAKQSGN